MRVLSRRYLSPLVMAVAALAAAAPAYLAASAPVHHTAALSRGCPAGTNWDTQLQKCV
jgi:hypothetical protein